jgi:hypothetical protein
MSLFGKIMVFFNVAAAAGFLFLAMAVHAKRQAWSHANFRHEVALVGFPVDREERTPGTPGQDTFVEKLLAMVTGEKRPDGHPRYLDVSDSMSKDLVGDPKIKTQEEELEKFRQSLQQKLDDQAIPGSKAQKLARVLLPLAQSGAEREVLLAIDAKSADNQTTTVDQKKLFGEEPLPVNLRQAWGWLKENPAENEAPIDLQSRFDEVFLKAKSEKEAERKKQSIARLLVALFSVFPDGDPADPFSSPAYKRVLNVLGYDRVAQELDRQAAVTARIGNDVAVSIDNERGAFAKRYNEEVALVQKQAAEAVHQQRVAATKEGQAIAAEQALTKTRVRVKELEDELAKARADTDVDLKQLEKLTSELFKLRLQLRDMNSKNQALELQIQSLERLRR